MSAAAGVSRSFVPNSTEVGTFNRVTRSLTSSSLSTRPQAARAFGGHATIIRALTFWTFRSALGPSAVRLSMARETGVIGPIGSELPSR